MQKIKQDVNIGDNLRVIRKSKELTQGKIVIEMQLRGCRITRSTYSRYETGELNIPVSHLVALASILECDYNDLFAEVMPLLV